MALADAALSSALDTLFQSIHDNPGAKGALSSAIQSYAGSATLNVPGTGMVDPNGVSVLNSTSATPAFSGGVLDSALDTLFSGSRSRSAASSLLASAIIDYAKTATAAAIPPGGLSGAAGPLIGAATAGAFTFDEAGLRSTVDSLFAQDNSASFAAAALAAGIKAFFKSGTAPVPATGYTAALLMGGVGPVTGQATGTIS